MEMGKLEHFWHVMITPGTELVKESVINRTINFLTEAIDPLAPIIIGAGLIIFILGGKKGGQVAYWGAAIYIVLKLVMPV